jgi:hypothetical protein
VDVPERHQQLIARLTKRGLVAEFRRWAMGDTISVADKAWVDKDGLENYNLQLYLYPAGESSWIIDTMYLIGGNCQSPPIAETEILERVAEVLVSKDAYARESRRW